MKYLLTLAALIFGMAARAGEAKDTLFLELTDSSTLIIPRSYIEQWEEDDQVVNIHLSGDTTVSILKCHIASQGNTYQRERPKFESFKFNNKFNDQLYTDAEGDINEQTGEITAEVGCIGKRLTPSFKLTDGASAYINGKHQYSKKSRLRFDEPVKYTVAFPKQYIYKSEKVKDEVWSVPELNEDQWIKTKIELTEDMLETNAPNNRNNEGLSQMLDGSHETFFHSTWGSGAYTPLTWYDGAYYGDGMSEWPYIQIQMPKLYSRIQFEYTTRNLDNYAPLGFILQGSNNKVDWDEVQTFTAEKDGLPTIKDATYLSPIINVPAPYYKWFRLQMTSSQKKNYLVFSEFAMYEVTENPNFDTDEPVLISPAEYLKGFYPYGTDYNVKVDFLTDHPTTPYNVPRIDIWFGDGETWGYSMWIGRNGKTFYEDATIKIDGAGVYPDMDETPMQIRGRGNSSWSNSAWSKNPYRIKFEEKQKPFGMTKGKSWVLLANKQTGSMTTNAIAMKVADMVESRGCNHIIPVELYINNQYRGSYNFTEKVGFSNNSIDISDESNATMLELDSYYDETYKFKDKSYNLPVNIKAPDFSDPTEYTNLMKSDIESAFNEFTSYVKSDAEYANFDVQSVIRAMLVTDLVRNEELMHPKSWFIYNEDIMADSLWNLGPVWDFDWSFGYERGHNYFITGADVGLFYYMGNSNIGYPFFRDLLRGSERVKKEYYRLWTNFLQSGQLDELIEYCDDYFEYARMSFEHNQNGDQGYLWGDGGNYDTQTTNAKNWLTKRANYIYTHLTEYDLGEDIIDPEDDYGQPDRVDLSKEANKLVDVYTINGVLVRKQVPYIQFNQGLMPGIYIVNGRKIAIGR